MAAVTGDGAHGPWLDDLEQLASQTGTVDANAGHAPIVIHGGADGAAQGIHDAIEAVITGLPLEVHAELVDDPTDGVDVAAFVDHVETSPPGTPGCPDGLAQSDRDGDGHPDTYEGMTPGTSACWRVVLRTNESVPATQQVQTFGATLEVYANEATLLDTRDVYFTVPPQTDADALPLG